MAFAPLEAHGLGKRFGARRALEGLDLQVEAGEIVALVGPNGSGKTTLLRLLAGLLRPTSGEARVFGLRPFAERAKVMARARFAFAPPALFPTLTAREHLVHLASVGGRRPPRQRVNEILERVGLGARADDRVAAFSFGMRQRLALAQALLPLPELLVLDEPTDGLDPMAVLELRALLRELVAEHGLTVVLSSHLLFEVGELVDRLVVLEEGRCVFQGRPAELSEGTRQLELEASDPARALAALREAGHDARLDGGLAITLPRGALTLAQASRLLESAGVELTGFHLRRANLERALLARLAKPQPHPPEGRP